GAGRGLARGAGAAGEGPERGIAEDFDAAAGLLEGREVGGDALAGELRGAGGAGAAAGGGAPVRRGGGGGGGLLGGTAGHYGSCWGPGHAQGGRAGRRAAMGSGRGAAPAGSGGAWRTGRNCRTRTPGARARCPCAHPTESRINKTFAPP